MKDDEDAMVVAGWPQRRSRGGGDFRAKCLEKDSSIVISTEASFVQNSGICEAGSGVRRMNALKRVS